MKKCKKVKCKCSKCYWLKAYRLARQPDLFLADDLIVDFPIKYFLYALDCSKFELGHGLGFKNFIKGNK